MNIFIHDITVQEREKLRGNDIENPEKDLFNEYPKR